MSVKLTGLIENLSHKGDGQSYTVIMSYYEFGHGFFAYGYGGGYWCYHEHMGMELFMFNVFIGEK